MGGARLAPGIPLLYSSHSPLPPQVLYFSLVLRQENSRTGKHPFIMWLWYCTLPLNQDVIEGPWVPSAWETSNCSSSCAALVCVLPGGWKGLLAARLLVQKMDSGRTPALSAPFPGDLLRRFCSCRACSTWLTLLEGWRTYKMAQMGHSSCVNLTTKKLTHPCQHKVC